MNPTIAIRKDQNGKEMVVITFEDGKEVITAVTPDGDIKVMVFNTTIEMKHTGTESLLIKLK
ncbi:hypothetical protein [Emticicia sp. C21]|uniref:hypothetical protein n=1 Tax=Emticicia sp. C21 TaxID=2302915 RepID=UPI000E342ABE|nr:hypothetical protein [Emticicia sp. C21]RFS17700.1 hypothetical protein D0T08_00135 [Emticicia sp. C21]